MSTKRVTLIEIQGTISPTMVRDITERWRAALKHPMPVVILDDRANVRQIEVQAPPRPAFLSRARSRVR